jgi:hypothetical protein
MIDGAARDSNPRPPHSIGGELAAG